MRPIAEVLVFLICLSAAAGALQASGLATAIGVSPNPGIHGAVHDVPHNASANRQPGQVTFVGAVVGGISTFVSTFAIALLVYPAATNLGLPAWAAALISAPVWALYAMLLVYMMSGRDPHR